jgi:predicted nucleic acid-binding Zn ribbon protein
MSALHALGRNRSCALCGTPLRPDEDRTCPACRRWITELRRLRRATSRLSARACASAVHGSAANDDSCECRSSGETPGKE